MTRTVLVTGATGSVGSALVRRLLADGSWHVIALTRDGSLAGLTPSERLTPVLGDVTRPGLGIEADRTAWLRARTTHICHLAASTNFGAPLDAMRKINVEGTAHVLELADGCRHLEQVGLASTVYVSGRRTGLIGEDELEHDAGFVNAYEQSKYEAEALARRDAGRLPVAVYRISTMFGDSRSGAVHHFTAPHQALRIMSLGLASMLPGTAGYRVNLIPTDLVVDALTRLLPGPAHGCPTYHLAAPDDRCLTLEDVIDGAFAAFSTLIPGWERRGYPRPAIVSGGAFDRFMDSVEQTGNPFLRGVMGALRHFAHQLLYPKTFDLSATDERLGDWGDRVPHTRTYFDRVLEHCVSTGWGSRGVPA